MQARCVNIDWLEVYCLEPSVQEPRDADYFRSAGFIVHEREYGTRMYQSMFTIDDDHGYPWIEVRRKPYSQRGKDGGFFPPESCHIRLNNRACYDNDPIGRLRDFLASHGYIFRKIYRLDICNDFVTLDGGDDPADFVARYMRGRYTKVNQTNLSAHGVDNWNARLWCSLSWGRPKSMVSTKMYCKSLELAQVHDKPYIRQAWFLSGLVDDPMTLERSQPDGTAKRVDVWRVEFSIKSSANHWFVVENSFGKKRRIVMPHSLDVYDTREKLATMFNNLAEHYFRFKVYEEGVRKDRCRDKITFRFSPLDTHYKLDRLASHSTTTCAELRLLRALRSYKMTTSDADVVRAADVLIDRIERHQLRDLGAYSAEDVRLLRLLIAQRMRRSDGRFLEEDRNTIRDFLTLFPDVF